MAGAIDGTIFSLVSHFSSFAGHNHGMFAGSLETIIFPAIWMYMLGCANASREDTQIVAKILPVFFPKPRPVAVFDFCARVFSLVISVWLTWHAVEYFFYSLETHRKTSYLFMPMYIGETAIAAGMILITAYCILHLSRSFRRLRMVLGVGSSQC